MSHYDAEVSLTAAPWTRRAVAGFLIVRLVVPCWLIFGAGVKYFTATPRSLPQWILATVERTVIDPVAIVDWLGAILAAVIAVELIAAGLILLFARLARTIAIIILTIFLFIIAAEASYLLRIGHGLATALTASCGCFGELVKVPMWIDFVINSALLAATVALPPRSPRATRRGELTQPVRTPKWAIVAGLAWLVLGVQAGFQFKFSPQGEGGWDIMSPFGWVDRPFHETVLFKYTEYDHDFYGGGEQTWILYRRSCPMCHELFEDEYSGDLGGQVVVAVEIPEGPSAVLGDDASDIVCPDCQWNRLRDGIDWIVDVPLIIKIDEDGIIRSVRNPKLVGAQPR